MDYENLASGLGMIGAHLEFALDTLMEADEQGKLSEREKKVLTALKTCFAAFVPINIQHGAPYTSAENDLMLYVAAPPVERLMTGNVRADRLRSIILEQRAAERRAINRQYGLPEDS